MSPFRTTRTSRRNFRGGAQESDRWPLSAGLRHAPRGSVTYTGKSGATRDEVEIRGDDVEVAPPLPALRPPPPETGLGNEPAAGRREHQPSIDSRAHAGGDALGPEADYRCRGGVGKPSWRIAH